MTPPSTPNSLNTPNPPHTWRVETSDNETTLLAFLQHRLPGLSGKAIKRHLEAHGCYVNGKSERFAGRRLWENDVVVWHEHKPPKKPRQATIIYEDEDLLAIDKPAGIVSEKASIAKHLGRDTPLWLVHRLDRETSGLLLIAKNEVACQALTSQFRERLVSKVYITIVEGSLPKPDGLLSNYLVRKGSYDGQTFWGVTAVEAPGALYAETAWHTLAVASTATLVECRPKTGRTHQLRVHLSSIGCPIVGDSQYGKRDSRFPRCLLHARDLTLTHPSYGTTLNLHAPVPADLKAAWQGFN